MPRFPIERSVAEKNVEPVRCNGQAVKVALLRASMSESEEGTRPYRSALAVGELDSHSIAEGAR